MNGEQARSFDLSIRETPGGPVPLLRRGPAGAPTVLLIQPLFEELNRCRRFLADLGREFATIGIASLLPDLPGEGDSSIPYPADGVAGWDRCVDALADGIAAVVAMRGGALIASPQGIARRNIAPARDGNAILRDMMRAEAFAEIEATGARVDAAHYAARFAAGETVRLVGYAIPPTLHASLSARTADEATAIAFEAAPIWRQAEPVRALAEARRIAAEIAEMVG